MRSYNLSYVVAAGLGLSALSGCSNFNLELSGALSYGDNQQVERTGSSTKLTFKENKIPKTNYDPFPVGSLFGAKEENGLTEEDLPVARQVPLNDTPAKVGVINSQVTNVK
jgi:hypothetical protein